MRTEKDDRVGDELHRRRQALAHVGHHRLRGAKGHAEVAPDHALDIARVLDVDRLIEPELAAHLLHPFLGRERPGVEKRRLARHLADEEEHDERHEQELHRQEQQASRDVAGEAHAIGERAGRPVVERARPGTRPEPAPSERAMRAGEVRAGGGRRPQADQRTRPGAPRHKAWRGARGGCGDARMPPRPRPASTPGVRTSPPRVRRRGEVRSRHCGRIDRLQVTCRAGRSGCCCRGTRRTPSTPP